MTAAAVILKYNCNWPRPRPGEEHRLFSKHPPQSLYLGTVLLHLLQLFVPASSSQSRISIHEHAPTLVPSCAFRKTSHSSTRKFLNRID